MRLMALVLLCFAANTALAQVFSNGKNKFYVGGGVNYVDAHVKDVNGNNVSFSSLEAHGGYKHSGFLGFEARVAVGLNDHTDSAGTVDSAIDYHASLYWRPETANQTTKIYGLLGFSSLSVSDNGDSASDSGLSFGGGVGFVMYDNWNLNFEYRSIINNDENEFTALGATVDFRF